MELSDGGPLRVCAMPRLVALAAGALALALQVQMTMGLGGPVRLALSDILLVLLAPLALFLLIRNRSLLLRAPRPGWLLLLLAATAAVSWGAAIGAWQGEGLTGWALKKYAGWFVLLGYGALGILLAFDDPERTPTFFVRCYVYALALIVVAFAVFAAMGRVWPPSGDTRLSGFVDNPNAFALMLLCGLAFTLVRGDEDGGRWTPDALAGILCAGLLFSQSMAGLAGLAVLVPVFLLLRGPRLARLARILAVAGLVFAAPVAMNAVFEALAPGQIAALRPHWIGSKVRAFAARDDGTNTRFYSNSIPSRIDSARRSVSLWLERPLFGAGLGAYLEREKAQATPERPAMMIHSTPLWLLTETGLVGLAIFVALFAAVAFYLYRAMSSLDPRDPRAPPLLAGLLILAAWGTMSLAHELLYQRALWFILGLCLGLAMHGRGEASSPGETSPARPV